MSQIYYIFKKTCYYHQYTKKVSDFDDQQTILTTKENKIDIPVAFSSVEKARDYLINKLNLKEITFLNFKSDYQIINDVDTLLKFTKYTIKSSQLN